MVVYRFYCEIITSILGFLAPSLVFLHAFVLRKGAGVGGDSVKNPDVAWQDQLNLECGYFNESLNFSVRCNRQRLNENNEIQ